MHFGISLDALILDNSDRLVEEMTCNKVMKPIYANMHNWEFYPSGLEDEYRQSVDEGLDIEAYKPVFDAVSKLPKNEIKNDFGNVISKIVLNANIRKDYKYI